MLLCILLDLMECNLLRCLLWYLLGAQSLDSESKDPVAIIREQMSNNLPPSLSQVVTIINVWLDLSKWMARANLVCQGSEQSPCDASAFLNKPKRQFCLERKQRHLIPAHLPEMPSSSPLLFPGFTHYYVHTSSFSLHILKSLPISLCSSLCTTSNIFRLIQLQVFSPCCDACNCFWLGLTI